MESIKHYKYKVHACAFSLLLVTPQHRRNLRGSAFSESSLKKTGTTPMPRPSTNIPTLRDSIMWLWTRTAHRVKDTGLRDTRSSLIFYPDPWTLLKYLQCTETFSTIGDISCRCPINVHTWVPSFFLEHYINSHSIIPINLDNIEKHLPWIQHCRSSFLKCISKLGYLWGWGIGYGEGALRIIFHFHSLSLPGGYERGGIFTYNDDSKQKKPNDPQQLDYRKEKDHRTDTDAAGKLGMVTF